MKAFIISSLLLTSILSNSFAQNTWNVASIPAELKEKAHAVIRKSETIFTVKNLGEATEKIIE